MTVVPGVRRRIALCFLLLVSGGIEAWSEWNGVFRQDRW